MTGAGLPAIFSPGMTRGNQPRAQDGEDEASPSSHAALAGPYPAGGWLPAAVQLPDGAWIRGRGLRHGDPGGPCPDFGLYLGVDYRPGWPHEHLAWPDFWLPRDARRAAGLLQHVHRLALDGRRVEIACRGGRGRTGTALAAVATLAGVPAGEAVDWVRRHYHRHAVETPWQRHWVRRFPGLVGSG